MSRVKDRRAKWFDSDPRMHRVEHAAEAIRREAAGAFRAEVTDSVLFVGQVKPLEVAHRAGQPGWTRCRKYRISLLYAIDAKQAIEHVMIPCMGCGFEEHTDE